MAQVDRPLDLVFVHLNSEIPTYLKLNLQSVIRAFPAQNIVLIHDRTNDMSIPKGVIEFRYSWSDELTKIDSYLQHPKDFRNNFWLTSIGRFDALRAYIETTGHPVIHIESDVILASDFPLSKFLEIEQDYAFPVVAQNRGVASTLYIRDLKAAKKLVKLSLSLSKENPNTNDMEILAELGNKFANNCLDLPFAVPVDDSFHEPLSSGKKLGIKLGMKKLGGIFDGNDIGVFLFGTDPRNRRGISKVRQEIKGNYSAVSNWRFKYDQQRQFLCTFDDNNNLIPIFSAHVTSKSLLVFWYVTRRWSLRMGAARSSQKPTNQLHFIILVRALLKKLLRSLTNKKIR